MVLSQEEMDQCRQTFLQFDQDKSGRIDEWELQQALEAMGLNPSEEEIHQASIEPVRVNTFTSEVFLLHFSSWTQHVDCSICL